MDPFYPLLYNNRGFTTPSCLEDSSSSDFRSDYSFNYNYATGYNLAPSQNPASWMQLDSAFSVSSHTTSRFKSSSSPMSLTPVPSVTDIMTQVSPIPCKLDAIDELPPRSKDAKRSRPPPETTENTSWSDDQESVTNDLKKIRLPTVETRSLYVKNLSGTKLFLEYVDAIHVAFNPVMTILLHISNLSMH